jgi:prevent-host-death family protein
MNTTGRAHVSETVAVSEFKARCLALLERVRRTGTPLVVTRHGKPIAEVVPPSAHNSSVSWLGSAAGTARITGDIVAPAAERDEWEACRS